MRSRLLFLAAALVLSLPWPANGQGFHVRVDSVTPLDFGHVFSRGPGAEVTIHPGGDRTLVEAVGFGRDFQAGVLRLEITGRPPDAPIWIEFPQSIDVRTAEGGVVRMTRFRTDPEGPVRLVPGVGHAAPIEVRYGATLEFGASTPEQQLFATIPINVSIDF